MSVYGRLVRPLAALIALLLIAAGCTKATPAAQDVRPTTVPVATTPAPSPVITLAFGGDVHFTGRTLRLLDDPVTAFGPIAQTLQAADFAMVNLETPVTERG